MAELTDPVPEEHDDAPGIRWLRRNVSRFANGPDHERRRAIAVALIADLDQDHLRRAAAAKAATSPHPEFVPVEVLAEALGLPVDPAAVRTIAAAYHPHTAATPAADRAIATLLDGGPPDEAAAVRISLLVQACDATAGLIIGAATRPGPVPEAIADTLRHDPPATETRRVVTMPADNAGIAVNIVVPVDIRATPFGAGPRACPGRNLALALATGVLEATR